MASSSRDPAVLRDKFQQAVQANDRAKVISLGRRLISSPRTSVQDCMVVAEMGQRFADPQITLLGMQAVLKRAPNNLKLLFDFAELEHSLCFTKEAYKLLGMAAQLCRTAADFDELGNKYGLLSEVELAHGAFAKAYAMAPQEVRILSNLAVSHGFMGEVEQAEELFDLAVASGATDDFIYLNRSWLRRQTEDRNHIQELEALVMGQAADQKASPLLLYALAKEYEDVGNNEAAFDMIEKAADAKRKLVNYSQEDFTQEIDIIIGIFDAEFVNGASDTCPSDEPIFIIGMPRSGSTLVERIIGTHPSVFAAGEMMNLDRTVQIKSIEAQHVNNDQSPDRGKILRQVDMRNLGKSYIASTRPRTGQTPHFTDKLPTNFLSCGLIARAMPNARIVHVARDPMDVCFAMYKQHFSEGCNGSYDQRELGAYYLDYLKLMAHWDTIMPNRIIHVSYENLVSSPEKSTRELIAHLGLEWDDACLDHTTNTQASTTASAAQVRQPIHTSSVGKWKQFEPRLAVLKQTLEAGGLKIG